MSSLECLHHGSLVDGDLTREMFFPQRFQFVFVERISQSYRLLVLVDQRLEGLEPAD